MTHKEKIINVIMRTLLRLEEEAFEGGILKLIVEVNDSPLATINLLVDGAGFRTCTTFYTRIKELK